MLTTLAPEKQGSGIVGSHRGEAKTASKTLLVATICSVDGSAKILEQLDKAYIVDKTNQLDADLANFLYYSWKKEVSVEHFILGFHTQVDKMASVSMDEKVNERLLLCQEDLQYHDKHVAIGAASGSYLVQNVSATMRDIY